MQLPGVQQAQPQQGSQQGSQQGTQQEKPSFPATQEEEKKFSNDILEVLVNEKIYNNTVSQLEQLKEGDRGQGVGMIAGQLVGNRLADVRGQTGRKLKMRVAIDATKATIRGIAGIARENQLFEMKKEEMQTALKTSVEMLDGASSNGKTQQGQQQPQQAQPQQQPQARQQMPQGVI